MKLSLVVLAAEDEGVSVVCHSPLDPWASVSPGISIGTSTVGFLYADSRVRQSAKLGSTMDLVEGADPCSSVYTACVCAGSRKSHFMGL